MGTSSKGTACAAESSARLTGSAKSVECSPNSPLQADPVADRSVGWAHRLVSATLSLFAVVGLSACGPAELVTNGQIIGGQDSTGREEFNPFVVALYDSGQGGLCTATILSDQFLVTAAHCVDNADPRMLRVIFGLDIADRGGVVVQSVETYVQSPVWPVRQFSEFDTGDIAVIKFRGGLPMGYRPARVLTDPSALANGVPVLLAGYGASGAVQTPQGMDHPGAGRLRSVVTSVKNSAYSASEILVEQSAGKGACHGDSGGPAYVKLNGQLYVWGVTSRGVDDPGDTCGVSAAYTSIPFYWSWISRTVEQLSQQPSQPVRRPALFDLAG